MSLALTQYAAVIPIFNRMPPPSPPLLANAPFADVAHGTAAAAAVRAAAEPCAAKLAATEPATAVADLIVS